MKGFVRAGVSALLGAAIVLSPLGCMKTSTGKSGEKSETNSTEQKKKKDGPPVRVEEKYGFTSEGAGG